MARSQAAQYGQPARRNITSSAAAAGAARPDRGSNNAAAISARRMANRCEGRDIVIRSKLLNMFPAYITLLHAFSQSLQPHLSANPRMISRRHLLAGFAASAAVAPQASRAAAILTD